jgi:hypothetical protein
MGSVPEWGGDGGEGGEWRKRWEGWGHGGSYFWLLIELLMPFLASRGSINRWRFNGYSSSGHDGE